MELEEGKVDGFVFCIAQKRSAAKLHKDMTDLVSFDFSSIMVFRYHCKYYHIFSLMREKKRNILVIKNMSLGTPASS